MFESLLQVDKKSAVAVSHELYNLLLHTDGTLIEREGQLNPADHTLYIQIAQRLDLTRPDRYIAPLNKVVDQLIGFVEPPQKLPGQEKPRYYEAAFRVDSSQAAESLPRLLRRVERMLKAHNAHVDPSSFRVTYVQPVHFSPKSELLFGWQFIINSAQADLFQQALYRARNDDEAILNVMLTKQPGNADGRYVSSQEVDWQVIAQQLVVADKPVAASYTSEAALGGAHSYARARHTA